MFCQIYEDAYPVTMIIKSPWADATPDKSLPWMIDYSGKISLKSLSEKIHQNIVDYSTDAF
jgi:hypothetical protein